MNLKIYGFLIGLIFAGGLAYVIYCGIQPREIEKIRMSSFATPTAVENSVLLSLGQELQESSTVLWGLESGADDAATVLTEFANMNQDPKTAFQVYIVDQNLEKTIPSLQKLPGERIDTREDLPRLIEGLQGFAAQHLRTIVVMPAVFATAKLPDSPAAHMREQGLTTMNMIFTNFPRRREQEKDMTIPCNVAQHDENGTGALGCEIVLAARPLYRKTFPKGNLVGLLNQISQNDFLFLLTREP